MTPWIEAMRLRTLPVSVAGVLAGTACAVYRHGFSLLPMAICLVFAIVAQIASNFANEYYDYRNGLDRKGREGYRRGVTEGDIKPESMLHATYGLIIFDALLGCSLIYWGGWWLIAVGIAVAFFAIGYSAGPFPLSHHGLGDIAVVIFFGFVPVIFTEYVQTGTLRISAVTFCTALAIGLLAANVLIVNNYRDADDDKAVGKRTTVVIFGRKAMSAVYLVNGSVACIALATATTWAPFATSFGWIVAYACVLMLWQSLRARRGSQLNGVLKFTSILVLAASVYLLLLLSIWPDGAWEKAM